MTQDNLTEEQKKLKQAMKEELMPLDGVIGVGIGPGDMLNVYIDKGKSLWELPNLFLGKPITFHIGKIEAQDSEDILLDDYE